jgi:pyruvate dehydrogenase E1 component
MGESGEGQNTTHSQKKITDESLLEFRDRFRIPLEDEAVLACKFFHPGDDSPEVRYLKERRTALGGSLPTRADKAPAHETPDLSLFQSQLDGSGDREISTTMAFVRLLTALTRDKTLGRYVVPIVPDESRTFGMEGMFRQLGIYAPEGQLYLPEDADQLMYYREDIKGQVLQEGITEAGAMSSWIAAATAYSNHGIAMIPFYIFYSMFGLQRVGDLAWAAGDQQARGFLIGGTAGRTTLAGEGLQHQDGHSLLMAASIPNCVSYDPAFSYELAVIVHDGVRRMYTEQENVFYYITVMNENYAHPPMPENVRDGILQGMYRLRQAPRGRKAAPRVQLFGSGTILRESMEAAQLLEQDFGVLADLWSVTSYSELARQGREATRWNRLHPDEAARPVYVSEQLADADGPIIAASDYNQAHADQIREFISGRRYLVLGTDGYGRSGTREQLRQFFEVDRFQIVLAALSTLADENALPRSTVTDAINRYSLNPEKPDPAFA